MNGEGKVTNGSKLYDLPPYPINQPRYANRIDQRHVGILVNALFERYDAIGGFHSMTVSDLEPYLRALSDLSLLPDDAPGFVRDLMEGTLELERFYMLSAQNDEQRNNIIRRFVRVSEVLRSGA